jgi:hypothetical protein
MIAFIGRNKYKSRDKQTMNLMKFHRPIINGKGENVGSQRLLRSTSLYKISSASMDLSHRARFSSMLFFPLRVVCSLHRR